MAHERAAKAAQHRSRILRWSVLGIVLVGTTAIITAHQAVRGMGRPAGVDALCPLGGVETLYSLFTGDGFLRRTAASALILLVGMLVMALVYRRSFCGQLCPLGALQGLFGALGSRVFKRRFTVPIAIDRAARWLKYAVLVVFAVWSWQAAELVMRPYDPWVAWAHLTSAQLFTSFGVGLVVLVLSLAGSLTYERFFCKYLCPTGALLGLISRLSVLRIRRDPTACIDCGRCDRACPMNVEVATAATVTSSECISCNECVNVCPAAGALRVTAPAGRRPSPVVATCVVVGLMAAIVGFTTISGDFDWLRTGPAEASGAGHHGGGEGGGGSSGTIDVRGSMSLNEIAATTGIPVAELAAEFGVPASALGQPLSQIKDSYGFTPHDVRVWVEGRLTE
jgi:ferredoxin